jgi:hypothetical protein
MALGLIAIGLFPIGFDRLFPLKNDPKGRRLWGGLLIGSVSLFSLGLMFGLLFGDILLS